MNCRKNQNSILYLTTLGVYLGLLLVGGTPCVLAQQAALTKEFNLKDEIDRRDDPEKEPTADTGSLSKHLQLYLRELDEYFDRVRKADDHLGSLYSKDPEAVLDVPCHELGGAAIPFHLNTSTRTILPILLNPEYRQTNWSWAPMACRPLNNAAEAKLRFTEIEVSIDGRDIFTYQFGMTFDSRSDALEILERFKSSYENIDMLELSARQKVLWQNTKLTKSDNKVFIVTRLPRGSLDSLLATDAK
ncbi:MAG: hypothetical protein ACT4O9_12700 [Blastocatellia bacterium]